MNECKTKEDLNEINEYKTKEDRNEIKLNIKESIAPWSNISKPKPISLINIFQEQSKPKNEIKEIKTIETKKFKFLLNRK